jgi:GT2 family glycosyltransferase
MSIKSDKAPLVSIIIVNYNGRKFLKKCLSTLLDTDYPNYEIVIIDNASTDRSINEIERSFGTNSKVKIIKNDFNLGHSEGCNIGASSSNGKYYVFLDSDIEFDGKSWLWKLVQVMENNLKIGLAQAKIVLSEDKQCLDYICLAVDALGTWTAYYGSKEEKFTKNFEILAASSGCCIIRREVFKKVGGFDKDYFIYDDDTDLSLRTRLIGYKVVFVSSAVVFHRGGILRGVSGRMLYYSSKNRLTTILKNYELTNACWKFFVLFFFTLIISAVFFSIKKHNEAKATIRGSITPLVNFPKIWKKRLIVQSKRTVKDSELLEKGLITNNMQYTIQDLRLKLKYII